MTTRGTARWVAEVVVMVAAIVLVRVGLEAVGVVSWLATVGAILVVAAGWIVVENRRTGPGG